MKNPSLIESFQLFLTIIAFARAQNSIHTIHRENDTYLEGTFNANNSIINYIPLASNENDIDEPISTTQTGDISNFNNTDEHPCKRVCMSGANLQCHYKFKVEWYYTMSKACYECPRVLEDCYREDCVMANGAPRSIVVVNRKLPGPSIEVCLGDEVVIEVENELMGETTTIHWHGHHQIGTPYMDGVPQVTQWPIESGSAFVYRFNATNAGTQFWHSHTGIQRGDGTFGAFIVNVPEDKDPHIMLYDFDEHIMSMADWDDKGSTDMFLAHYHYGGSNKPSKLLINGLGIRDFKNPQNNTPIARFVVERGYRYRIRLINAGFLNCPIEMSIDNHTMIVISSDGNDFAPVMVDSLVSYAGERFDFVLNADQTEDFYWIRYRGLMDCDERFTKVHQVAVLQYVPNDYYTLPENDTFPMYETSHRDGVQLNPLNKGVESADKKNEFIAIPQLEAVNIPDDGSLREEPDEKFFITYDFYKKDHPMYHKKDNYGFDNVPRNKQVLSPQLNHISFKLLSEPLLPARDVISDKEFCNETTVRSDCKNEVCQCTHVLQVKLNSIVELILVDAGVAYDANHPFHLHGHSFRVVGMERLSNDTSVEEVKELDRKGLLKRNLVNPPRKDTVTIPDGGYTIVRFNASNPGYWLFHCHIDFHVEVGMALVFKFGENSDMPTPPKGFPTHQLKPNIITNNVSKLQCDFFVTMILATIVIRLF